MNSRERVAVAMRNGTPDRVPIIPQICHPHAVKALRMDFRETIIECVKNPPLVNTLDLACARLYGVDALRIWLPPDPITDLVDDGENVWQMDEKTGEKIGRLDFYGGGWIHPLKEYPVLTTMQDVEKQEVVPADKLLQTEKYQSVAGVIREARASFFTIGCPRIFTFEHVTFMRGKQQALMDIIEQPDFVKAIIDKAVDVSIQQAIALVKSGIDALYLGETFGGLIGPRLFAEFCVPALQRFVKSLREFDVLIYLHICGKSMDLLELMADTGVDCIEPLDPLGGVNIADAKKRVGNRVALMGGVNTFLLSQGSLDEVIADCRRCLNEGAPGGGYILAAGDMLPTETSREKVETMVEMAKNYKYR
jgi:uroporphyrinogen-III decarboxylase